MIDFFYKNYPEQFRRKSQRLSEELRYILDNENIHIEFTNDEHISLKYKQILGDKLYKDLNGIYYSIRKNNLNNHFILKNYLPENKIGPKSGILFADFFCGAGGMSLGFKDAGFTPAFANDIYSEGLETYYFNHDLSSDRILNCDIKKIVKNYSSIKGLFENIKIVIGGPPCQGFSMANRHNFEYDETTDSKIYKEDERNILYKYLVELIILIQPDFFLIENVKGMSKIEDRIMREISDKSTSDYYFISMLLNAKNYGVPQNRLRYFILGGKDNNFLEKVRIRIKEKELSSEKFVLEDALYGLPVIKSNPYKMKTEFENDETGYTIVHKDTPENQFLKEINKNLFIPYIFNHKARYNNENDIDIFRLLPIGGNSIDKSISNLNNYKNRDHIFKDKYYKLKPDEICKTVTSHMRNDCHMYIHPFQPRGLSPREAARVQTFPDYYLFRGSLNNWYKQIGNAVPVKLASVIAEELFKFYK